MPIQVLNSGPQDRTIKAAIPWWSRSGQRSTPPQVVKVKPLDLCADAGDSETLSSGPRGLGDSEQELVVVASASACSGVVRLATPVSNQHFRDTRSNSQMIHQIKGPRKEPSRGHKPPLKDFANSCLQCQRWQEGTKPIRRTHEKVRLDCWALSLAYS